MHYNVLVIEVMGIDVFKNAVKFIFVLVEHSCRKGIE